MLTSQGAYTDAELKETANATLGWWHHSIENRLGREVMGVVQGGSVSWQFGRRLGLLL